MPILEDYPMIMEAGAFILVFVVFGILWALTKQK